MNDRDDLRKVLEEIRDTQREHLAEYRKAAQQSLELQRVALERQAGLVRIYRRLVLVVGMLMVVLVAVVFLHMQR